MRMTRVVGLAVAGLASAMVALPAYATPPDPAAVVGTLVEVKGQTLTVKAGAKRTNDIKIVQSGSRYLVSDTGDYVTGRGGCTRVDARKVSCPLLGIDVDANDQNDTITVDSAIVVDDLELIIGTLHGGDGNDQIQATTRTTALVLEGGPGNDTLVGGRGHDHLDGQAGADSMYGKAGIDVVLYEVRTAPVVASLDNVRNDGQAKENDWIRPDVENIEGGSGNDQLTGNNGTNYLDGNAGANVIRGLGGNDHLTTTFAGANDQLYGDGGNDSLSSGGGNDRLDGGAGNDVLHGGPGTDTLRDHVGEDRLFGDEGHDTLHVLDLQSNDQTDGGSETDTCHTDNSGTVFDFSPLNCEVTHH